jgi:RNA polymerase primary sigma factor
MHLHQFTEIPPEVGAEILKTHGLTYRERETVKMRFGLGDGFVYTHAQIAEVFRVTPDEVREWEKNASRKLKNVEV